MDDRSADIPALARRPEVVRRRLGGITVAITARISGPPSARLQGMGRYWFNIIGIAAAVAAATAALARSPNPEMSRAQELYRSTQYREAIDALQALDRKDAAGYALLGKAYYLEGRYKEAIANLERAVAEDSHNSDYYDWLGRAYGRSAETSGFMSALSYAKKTVRAFERAVEAGPSNLEALSDLFEFYLQAPGMVGGGVDKAVNVARQISSLDQAEGHWASARLAEKRKDWAAAEREYHAAWDAAPDEAGRALDLAAFLSSRGRFAESDAIFCATQQKHPHAAKVMFARAAAYVQSGRNLEEARALLDRYVAAQTTPDDPPRWEVRDLARRLNEHLGKRVNHRRGAD